MRRAGVVVLSLMALAAAAASWLAPNPPQRGFPDLVNAPPTRVRVWDGGPRAPFIYRQRLVSRLERTFANDTAQRISLRWFDGGVLVTADPETGAPLLLLGADGYGRDIFARLLHGARLTLALALLATLGATALGGVVGSVSGYAGGRTDLLLSRLTEFVLVLPAIYVVLALRAALPLVVPPRTVFLSLAGIFVLLGWPTVARGVRAIVASERARDYVVGRRGAGGAPWPRAVPASAARGARPPGHPGHAAAAGLHPGRGDDVVHRPGVSRGHAHLGHDAAGGSQCGAAWRCAVGPGPGRGDLPRGSGREPRGTGPRATPPRYNWIDETVRGRVHAHRHAVS